MPYDATARRSPRRPWEFLALARAIPPEELQRDPARLDAVLREILAVFPKLSLTLLTTVLLPRCGHTLADAVRRLESHGFGRYVSGFRAEAVAAAASAGMKSQRKGSREYFNSLKYSRDPWRLDDFDLVREVWGSIVCPKAREWLAEQFLRYWQTVAGENELRTGGAGRYGETLLRFKVIARARSHSLLRARPLSCARSLSLLLPLSPPGLHRSYGARFCPRATGSSSPTKR